MKLKLPKDIKLLFEDDFFFIIDKPALIHSVDNAGSKNQSLASTLLKDNPGLASAGPKAGDAGLVQRLDFETSGVIMGAKERRSWEKAHELILAGEVEKSYWAILEGKMPNKLRLDTYIGSPYRRAKKVRVYSEKPSSSVRSLKALTRFQLLKYDQKDNISICRIHADTARRHQIRAHASFAGHALIGDKLYGATRTLAELKNCAGQTANLPPFCLHAESIGFMHPFEGGRICVNSPKPTLLAGLKLEENG